MGMVPVVMSTVSTLMIPLVGVISGAMLLGEHPGRSEIASLALVAMAIALVVRAS